MKKFLSLLMLLMTAIPAINATDYKLVTRNEDLEAGAKYIITNNNGTIGMSKTQNDNNRGQVTDLELVDNIITLADDSNVAILTLGTAIKGAEELYTLYDPANSGYLYAASGSKNYLKTKATLDDNGKCTISIESNEATIKFQGNYTRNWLRYNAATSGGQIFSCYSTGQQAVRLYKEYIPKAVADVSISYDESATYFTGDKVSVTLGCVTDSALIYYTTDGTEPSATNRTLYGGTALELTSATVGDVTVKAIAVKGAEKSKVTEATVHFNRAVASVEEFNGVADGELVRFDFPLTASVATTAWIFAQDSANNGVYLRSTDFRNELVANYTLNSIIKEGLIGEVTTLNGNKELQFQIGSLVKDDAEGSLTAKTVNFSDFSDTDLYKYVKVPEVNLSAMDELKYFAINGIENTGYNKKGIKYPATVAGKAFDLYGIYYKDKVSEATGYMFIPLEIKEVVAAFEAPVISVESGTYNVVQNVTLTVPEGTTVRYTTDKAVDLKEGTGYLEYSNGTTISILKSCTLRAIATDGTNFSPVATATYTMKTAAPVITAEGAVDGVFRTETLDVTISSQYDFENVIFECNVTKEDGTTEEIEVTSNPFTFQIAGTTSITLTALYGDFDISDVVETTFTYMDPNIAVYDFTDATKWGYDQPTSGGKTVIDGVTLKISDEYPTISNVAGGGTKTRFYGKTGAESVLRAYSKNTLTFTAPANLVIEKIVFDFYNNKTISSANTKWSVGEYDTKAYTWSGASQVVSVTLGETNVDINSLTIYVKDITAVDQAGLLSMEAGKYYQVNVNLQGVKSHNGVLYARTVDTTVNPSEPGKDYFDSYEDSNYAQFAQHDWVAIDGLGSDYENKNITAGFVAQYDGTKLLPVNDVVPGSDETVTTNTFGVANVFYGNYENTNGFGYKPFFVKAKLNEVATFVAKAVAAYEIQGSGECGVINGKGLKVEGSDLTDNIGKYVALDGVLVADAEANGGVKVIVFGVGTPTGVDSAIAEGTVAIYGTEGAVSVTGVTGTVELYDATGRLAKVAEVEGSAVIAMPAGYYIVRASGVAKAVIVK